jgi:hypothetical protein
MRRRTQNERGVAVIVMIVLIAIVLLYISVTAHTLHWLGHDLRLIEQHQIQRATNSTATAPPFQEPARQPNHPAIH